MDPWAFGWTQVFTLIGFFVTIIIAVAGFRTFGRWRREKLEERRMEIAFDALTVVHKSKFVFEMIRAPLIESYEWHEMPEGWGKTEEERRRVGPHWSILKRIRHNKDFFEHAWDVQTRCMAMFGPKIEEPFILMHRARRTIEVAAQMLADDASRSPHEPRDAASKELYKQLRADIDGYGRDTEEGDRVGTMLETFRTSVESICRPVIDQEFGRSRRQSLTSVARAPFLGLGKRKGTKVR